MYFKDFNRWNKLKKKVDSKEYRPPFFKEGQVWWAKVGLNIGTEMDGKGSNFTRPVLILKKFNKYQFLAIPLTTKEKKSFYHLKVVLNHIDTWAVIYQVKTLNYKRLEEQIVELNEKDFRRVAKSVLEKFSPPITQRSRGIPQ